jgi:hypothetical protein
MSALFSPSPSSEASSCDRRLTYVEIAWFPTRVQRWIRFGRPNYEQVLDRRHRLLGFAPGSVFAFVRWAGDEWGTTLSRLDILRAIPPGGPYTTVPGVTPGGESLLRVSGWSRVQVALQAIDAVDLLGIDPAEAAPDHWRHVQNRLAGRETPRAYSIARHRAWRLRQALDT